jgi:hypothetical protein
MRRCWEVVRALLLAHEHPPFRPADVARSLELPEQLVKENMLMLDGSGLVEPNLLLTTSEGGSREPVEAFGTLTWRGMELLDIIRHPTHWERVVQASLHHGVPLTEETIRLIAHSSFMRRLD